MLACMDYGAYSGLSQHKICRKYSTSYYLSANTSQLSLFIYLSQLNCQLLIVTPPFHLNTMEQVFRVPPPTSSWRWSSNTMLQWLLCWLAHRLKSNNYTNQNITIRVCQHTLINEWPIIREILITLMLLLWHWYWRYWAQLLL